MRKLILIAGAVAALAAPMAALADPPTNIQVKGTTSQGNGNAVNSSQITQNGLWVSAYQTTYPGERADLVQGVLGH